MNKNKPKLLYIITQGHWGGAQKYVFDLATALADDFDITVAAGEPRKMPDLQKKLLKDSRVKLVQLNFLQRAICPIRDSLALLEIGSLYKKIQPDIVHLNSTKAGVLGSLFSPKKKCLMLYTVHGWVFNEPMSSLKKKVYKFLEKISAKKKDKIIVLSEDEKNIGINELGIKKEKFEIIPVGIEKRNYILDRTGAIREINSILKNNVLNENDYIFGTIANFYPTKNLVGLIEAFNNAKDKLKNFHSVFIGDGEERKKIESLIKKYNLESNIHLLGFIENAEKLLKAFNVFVLPSKKEGTPYTIMEAKANGIPVIATNVGSISKLIENKKTGLLLEPENITKLAEGLIYAYEHPEEIKKMAENAKKESTSKFLKTDMISKTENLYRSISSSK